MITVLDQMPDGLLTAKPSALADLCDELTVIHLKGAVDPPVVLSLMLHGNEPAGLLALQHLFGELGARASALPRSLTLLIGNVLAAQAGVRRLDDQADFNRIWQQPQGRAVWALKELEHKQPLALLDVHNSSGHNPHFVGVTKLDRTTLGLAFAFSTRVVNVTGPSGMLAQAAADFTPSVTLECGAPHDPDGFKVAAKLAHRLLETGEVPVLPEAMPVEVLENMCSFRLRDNAELAFPDDLERNNFVDVPVGTPLAFGADQHRGLFAIDRDGEEVTERFLRYEDGPVGDGSRGGRFVSTSPFVPVMMTLDQRVMRQDCLGYAMKRRRVAFD
jgi:succinylglutamate desuccinylase